MDSTELKALLAEISRPLDSVEVSSDMHPSVREGVAAVLDEVAGRAEREVAPAARASADPDLRDEAARLFRRLAQTNSWLEGRDARTRDWIDRAAELAASEVLRDLIASEQNRQRDPAAFAGIRELLEQGRVDRARRTLAARLRGEPDPLTRKRIEEVLADPRNFLAPIRSAPSMSTVNGIGTALWGSRAARPDGTHVATLCLVVLFIPLFPLRAYLVRRHGEGWAFFGRVPLSSFALWCRRLVLGGPLLAALAFGGWEAWDSSPYVQENRRLSTAASALDRRDYPGTVSALSRMTGTKDAVRAARMDEIGRKAVSAALQEVRDAPSTEPFLRLVGSVAARSKRQWVVDAEAEAALDRVARSPDSARAARNFVEWMGEVSPVLASRKPDLAARACGACDDPLLLAAALEMHRAAGRPFPPPLLSRLRDHLLSRKHESWDLDALAYLKADPPDAGPVLLARVEAAWKGRPEPELRSLKNLPEPLARLLSLDEEPELEKRAEGLEKAAAAGALEEPQKSWHGLGVSTRLVAVYSQLYEKDPIRFPVSKSRPWAVRAAELAPQDAGARVAALRALLADGDFDRAVRLGTPHQGDPKTALLLGVALARSDRLPEAAAILRPLVAKDFAGFTRAVKEWEQAVNSKTKNAWSSLQNGWADQKLIARLNSLSREQATAEAEQWVRQQVERDPAIASLAEKWRQASDVHPAASELALVELGLARAVPPGAERQERLKAAEKLFLDLREIGSDDPHQELRLGQVCLWLGKEKEGSEIFGKLETAGDPQVLMGMGEILRELGRLDDARRVLESGFAKAGAELKSSIAARRAQAARSLTERLEWLRKASTEITDIRVEIDQTEAEISMDRGDYGSAVGPLKRALAHFAGLPESSASRNNAALAQLNLADATGDLTHQLEALRSMRRASELSPENGIVLGNYVDLLGDVGIAALAGPSLRADLLHERPKFVWLEFVQPPLSRSQRAERAAAQAELRRAAELGAKAVILSPDGIEGYVGQSLFFRLTRNGEALRRLRESVESNPPVRRDVAARNRSAAKGEIRDSERQAIERQLSRWELLLPVIRREGHAPTLAYALLRSAEARLAAFQAGIQGATLEAALKEADEAGRTLAIETTLYAAAWIRLEQVGHAYATDDADFAAWMKGNPGFSAARLLPLFARRHPGKAAAIRGREDFRRAVADLAAIERFADREPSVWGWAWLELAEHEARRGVAEAIRNHPVLLEAQRLDRLLSPESPIEEAETWLTALVCGETELAAKLAAAARASKVFPALFGE